MSVKIFTQSLYLNPQWYVRVLPAACCCTDNRLPLQKRSSEGKGRRGKLHYCCVAVGQYKARLRRPPVADLRNAKNVTW